MIPVCEPVFNGREEEYLVDCIRSGWVASGKYIPALEEIASSQCNASEGVACSSGTAALHLATLALDIGPGDEIIVPSFTLIANANVIIMAGARPVFVDVDPEYWCIDPKKIEQALSPRTKAIVAVHMYGHPCDMDPLLEIADRFGLAVIEDAAQAHGALYKGRAVGGIGHVGCFSFYGNKIITAGEGGMIVTNDKKIADHARLLRNQAFEEPRFIHHHLGFNYRLSNVHAAIGLGQYEMLDEKVEKKRRVAERYNALLDDAQGITLPVERDWAKNVYWMYGVVLDDAEQEDRDRAMTRLREAGIDTRAFFYPLHRQPLYTNNDHPCYPDTSGRFPISERLWSGGFYLPSGIGLTSEDQERVADALMKCL